MKTSKTSGRNSRMTFSLGAIRAREWRMRPKVSALSKWARRRIEIEGKLDEKSLSDLPVLS